MKTRYFSIVLILFVKLSAAQVVDVEGNKYATLKIGNREWMIENLRSKHLNDGTSIGELVNYSDRTFDDRHNPRYFSENKFYNQVLYNWEVVNTQKIAPKGWHVATVDDWLDLFLYVLKSSSNNPAALKQLQSTTGWPKLKTGNYWSSKTCPNCSYWTPTQREYNYCAVCRNTRLVNDKFIPLKIIDQNGNNKSGFNFKPSYYLENSETSLLLMDHQPKFWTSTYMPRDDNSDFSIYAIATSILNLRVLFDEWIGITFDQNTINGVLQKEDTGNFYPIRCVKDDDQYFKNSGKMINIDDRTYKNFELNKAVTSTTIKKENISSEWSNCIAQMAENTFYIFIDKPTNKSLGFVQDETKVDSMKVVLKSSDILVSKETCKYGNIDSTFTSWLPSGSQSCKVLFRKDGTFVSDSKYKRGKYTCTPNNHILLTEKELKTWD